MPTLLWESAEKLPNKKRKQLTFLLENWEQETLSKQRENKEIIVRAIDITSIMFTPGWWPQERTILKECSLKFGVGCYDVIRLRNYLPSKTLQQMESQLRRVIGRKYIRCMWIYLR